MNEKTHKSGEGTVVMKECGDGYIVTVHKGAMPPHYSKVHSTRDAARADFDRLTGGISDERIKEVTEIVNREVDEGVTEDEVRSFVLYDWHNADEHLEWLADADADEIADWIIVYNY